MCPTAILRIVIVAASILPTVVYSYGEDADAEDVVQAAKSAVERLGNNRGALNISGEVVGIVGMNSTMNGSGVALTADVEQLQQAIQNLDADVKDLWISISLSSDVLFDFDRFKLKDSSRQVLNDLKTVIENSDVQTVTVVGHTDAKGSEEYNQRLSLKRAESVRHWLVTAGIDPALIVAEGHGEREPVAPNQQADGSDNPQGRALNRRVAVLIKVRKPVAK